MDITKDYLDYTKMATSPYQVVEASVEKLKKANFKELDFKSTWSLAPGKYYTVPYGTCAYGFVIGRDIDENVSLRMAASHTDHPCLRVKPKAEIVKNDYLELDIEVYGGAILNTWLDRPLSIAGKVALKSEDAFSPKTVVVDFKRPLLTIPNLAIHLNRDVNSGVELNKQTQMIPVIGMLTEELEKDDFFVSLLAKEAGVSKDDILDFDLYIYSAEEGCLMGISNELISAPRLDNLTSCYAAIEGLLSVAGSTNKIQIACLFDNEEVGSRSKQGADSLLTNMLLEKIFEGLSMDKNQLNKAVLDGFLLSMDVAHAYHPNYGEKYDPNLTPKMNGGVILKLNYNQRYATDTEALATVQMLCEKANIPYQKYVNRSDIPGGGTLGTITSAYLPMKTVDLGVGILAMHSAREMMGKDDLTGIVELAKVFFA